MILASRLRLRSWGFFLSAAETSMVTRPTAIGSTQQPFFWAGLIYAPDERVTHRGSLTVRESLATVPLPIGRTSKMMFTFLPR